MRRSVSFAVLAAAVVWGASALTAPPRNLAVVAGQKAESAEVKIDNFSFGPPTLTVSVGAILMAVALPALRNLLLDDGQATRANNMWMSLNLARSDGTAFSDPQMRQWKSGGSGDTSTFSWSA